MSDSTLKNPVKSRFFSLKLLSAEGNGLCRQIGLVDCAMVIFRIFTGSLKEHKYTP